MLEPTQRVSQLANLEQAITERIVQRTGQRIKSLRVEVNQDRVIIQGRAATYFLKQLALQGVFDVLGPRCPTRVQLDVQVVSRSPVEADSDRETSLALQ
jgi:hypothetical protein